MNTFIFIPLNLATAQLQLPDGSYLTMQELLQSGSDYYISQLSDGISSISCLSIDCEEVAPPQITVIYAADAADDKPVIVIGTCTHPPHRPPVAG